MSTWRHEVSVLASTSQNHLAHGDAVAAAVAVDAGFAIIDREGNPDDVVCMALVLIAAELALSCGEAASALALFNRCLQIGYKLDPEQSDPGDLGALRARALMGAANCHLALGDRAAAKAHFEGALFIMGSLQPPPPESVLESLRKDAASCR